MEEGAFTNHDLRLLRTMSGSLVIAIENVRLFARLKRSEEALVMRNEALKRANERLQELRALQILEEMSRTNVFVDALERGADQQHLEPHRATCLLLYQPAFTYHPAGLLDAPGSGFEGLGLGDLDLVAVGIDPVASRVNGYLWRT